VGLLFGTKLHSKNTIYYSATVLVSLGVFGTFSWAQSEGELIPRSMTERAEYYLISVDADGAYLRSLHKRVSAFGVGYSITRIDCNTRRYQDLGYGDSSEENIRMYDDVRWTDLVSGSSKSDLVTFVCSRR